MHLRVEFKEVAEFCKVTFDRKIEIRLVSFANQSQVYGNAGQLKQMLLNFCINARDAVEMVANEDYVPRIELGVETIYVEEGDSAKYTNITVGEYIRIYVADNGVGMDDVIQFSRAYSNRFLPPRILVRGRDWGWPRSTVSCISTMLISRWKVVLVKDRPLRFFYR